VARRKGTTTSNPNSTDIRFATPLYTVSEAARFLDVPPATFGTWVRGRGTAPPIVTSLRHTGRSADIPFVGLVEGLVAAAFRRSGVSMQHIRAALAVLREGVGLEHALASRALYTDGAAILYDYATASDDEQMLAVVLTGQRVFTEVITAYLKRITYATDGWAERLVLPITAEAVVEVDPRRAFGQPLFIRGGARMEDVIDRFRAGEPLVDVVKDFDLRFEDVEAVIRASLAPAA
jgi:uncharacterized protein (DUF433 family)